MKDQEKSRWEIKVGEESWEFTGPKPNSVFEAMAILKDFADTMTNPNRVICIDIGYASVKMAEFSYKGEKPVLHALELIEYEEISNDENRWELIRKAIKDGLSNDKFTAQNCRISISGQSSFVRFVKLPPIPENRIKDIVQYEAQQNIPFSLDNVVWGYHLFEVEDSRHLMLVVTKREIIDKTTSAVNDAGLSFDQIDFEPAAILNVAHKISEPDSFSVVLDIGDRSSTLAFIDGDRIFIRTIPIAGLSITQKIAEEFGLSYEDAERVKKKQGSLAIQPFAHDGVPREARNVMTRLYEELNRSLNVFRVQERCKKKLNCLYLSGGGAILNDINLFFAEKMKVDVKFLNPLECVEIEGEVSPSLLHHAYVYPVVVGMALRGLDGKSEVPIQFNLKESE